MALKFRNPLIRQVARKQAPPPEPKPEPATAVTEPAPAAVQAAAGNLKVRSAEDSLKASAPGAEPGARTEPATPGQQSNDSGVKTGPGVVDDLRDRRAAPGSDSSTAELDAAADEAFAKLADARPDLRMPTDVFEAAAGTESTPVQAGEAVRARLGQERPDLFGSGTDGGQEHAGEVVDQLLSGGVGQFGNRMAGLEQEIAITTGLIGDQQARETAPSAAKGSNPLTDAINGVTEDDVRRQAEKSGVTFDAFGPGATGGHAGEAESEDDSDGAGESDKGLFDRAVDFIREASAPTNVNQAQQLKEVDDGIGKATETQTVAEGHEQHGIKNLEAGVGKVLGGFAGSSAGGGVKDPGPDGEGGLPTEAEIAFRQSVRDALGIRPNIGGDIDPQEESATAGAAGPITDVVNDNDSLIGQPNENRVVGSGHTGPLPGGGDIDPLEGSAFTGPSRGGNPEDLDFGTEVLGLDAARRSTAEEEDEEEEEEEDDDA